MLLQTAPYMPHEVTEVLVLLAMCVPRARWCLQSDDVPKSRRQAPDGESTVAFQVVLPALGSATVTIDTAAAQPAQPAGVAVASKRPNVAADYVLENENVKLSFSRVTGRLDAWVNKASNVTASIDQSFCYYLSSLGGKGSTQPSGAYIFRPESQICYPVHPFLSKTITIETVEKGGVVQEIRQHFAPWLTQTVRLAAGNRHATFEFTVGEVPLTELSSNTTAAGAAPAGKPAPTPVKLFHGHEIVSRFSSSIASNGELLTDSNGREMMLRKRNYRPTWKLNQTEPVAGNYFPCNGAVAIKDDKVQLTVLVDSSQGVASINDGEIEIMVHRRLTVDDHRGVGEPLDEREFVTTYVSKGEHGRHYGPGLIVRGRHSVLLEPVATAAQVWRPLMDRIFGTPKLSFSTDAAVAARTHPSFSALAKPLPPNVQLMTLKAMAPGVILLRLAHQFAISEDPTLSAPVMVDLSTLFSKAAGIAIINVTEVSLTANMDKAAIMRKRALAAAWPTVDTGARPHPWRSAPPLDFATDPMVKLGPMEIKTFKIACRQ